MCRGDRILFGTWAIAMLALVAHIVWVNITDPEPEWLETPARQCRLAAERIVLNRRPNGDLETLYRAEATYSQFCPIGYGLPTLPEP